MLRQLIDRGLVRIVGHHDSLGRPLLYGTTRKFLETFGLADLADLPMSEQLRAPAHEKSKVAPVIDPVAERIESASTQAQ
jgi:chromosome segregation and condensation protein ScpB